MNEPVFSVIIPVYNRAHLISGTISAVLKQSFENFEIVVVDDGSTDNLSNVVTGIGDGRVIYYFQENRGRSAARNYGAKCSRSPFITFLDSDDEALPDWLSTFAEAFKDSKTAIACCGFIDRKNRTGGSTDETVLPHDRGPLYGNQKVLFQPPGTFALRREIFEAVGGYDEKLEFSENTELAMRIVPHCLEEGWEIRSCMNALVIYNRRSKRSATQPAEFQVLLQSAKRILEVHGSKLQDKFPRGYANYCGIAGVNAARLGRKRVARDYFLSGIMKYPWNLKNAYRLLLTFIPRSYVSSED